MHRLSFILVLALSACFSCAGPAHAPEDYESILAFLFEHMADEDDAQLVAAVENLEAWLQDSDQISEALFGFQIDPLADSAVDGVDEVDRDASNLLGLSFARKSPHLTATLAETLTAANYSDIAKEYSPAVKTHEQWFTPEDTGCFATKECTWIEADNQVTSTWDFLGDAVTTERLQYRWIETTLGWVFLRRSWLLEPSPNSGVDLLAQYQMNVIMPQAGLTNAAVDPGVMGVASGLQEGATEVFEELQTVLCGPGALRLEAHWMKIEYIIPLTDEYALELAMTSAKSNAEALDAWILAEEGAPPAAATGTDDTVCE
jgi:hypothetical protein